MKKISRSLVNGICDNDCLLFYAFISKFNQIIDVYNKQNLKKDFNRIIPDDSIIFEKKSLVMQHLGENIVEKMYCVKKRNKPISFLTHLRNAIAHGGLIYNSSSKTFLIYDKIIEKKRNGVILEYMTALGCYNRNKIVQIVEYFLDIINK